MAAYLLIGGPWRDGWCRQTASSQNTAVTRARSKPRGLHGVLSLPAPLLLACACGLLTPATTDGASPPPADSLSISFIDVGQGDGVLVQAGGENYLIDAGRPEEGPNVVDFLRSRGVESFDGIEVTNPPIS